MIVRVAQRAALSKASQVVVATDSEAVATACQAHEISAILTRSDHPSGSDRLAEACALLGLHGDDLIVNVQGDEPFIDPQLIDAVAQTLAQRPDCVMASAAHPIASFPEWRNPNVVKVVCDAQDTALYFSRAPIPAWRDAPVNATDLATPPPLRHIGIYAYRAQFLALFPTLAPAPLEQSESLEQLRALWHGHRIAMHITTQEPGIGVDTPEDLAAAQMRWSQL